MKVMILAAGRGERMGSLTQNCPKPLLKVKGRSLIDWHLIKLCEAGFKDVVINVAYLSKNIIEFVGDGSKWGLNISISEEEHALETAGGIKKAMKYLGDEAFAVINADIFSDYNYKNLKNNEVENEIQSDSNKSIDISNDLEMDVSINKGKSSVKNPEDKTDIDIDLAVEVPESDTELSKKDIDSANNNVNRLQNEMTELSEMAKIRNLHWWTVEYGLIGTLENPKLYGAGLLSSIEESRLCLQKEVRKLPYSIEAATVNFDITSRQPQLFVIPNFSSLSFVLEKFANTMAIRTGGLKGIQKLITSKKMGTIELNTGIQISGTFATVINYGHTPIYFQTNGPTALANVGTELIGHGIEQHPNGYGSTLGKLEGINTAIEDMSPKDLEVYGIIEGKSTSLNFVGGIKVEGEIITGKRDLQGKIILISLKNCLVTHNETVLFDPSWGVYDMAIGNHIASAFAGP